MKVKFVAGCFDVFLMWGLGLSSLEFGVVGPRAKLIPNPKL